MTDEFVDTLRKMVISAEQNTLDAVHNEERVRVDDPEHPMSHQVTYQFGFAEGLRAALRLAETRARRQENA